MEKSGLSMSPLSHLVTRLRTAEIVYDPYPHYYLENVFPAEYYEALLRHLPASAVYENHPSYVAIYSDDFRHRVQRNMDEGWTKNLPAELREFWDSFNKWFLGPELAQAALESFAGPLERPLRRRNAVAYGFGGIPVLPPWSRIFPWATF